MSDDLHKITIRRGEVAAEIKRLQDEIAACHEELSDLDTAARVVARLSGAKWTPASAADAKSPPNTRTLETNATLTMPQMIKASLRDAREKNLAGLEPREITAWIAKTYQPDVKGEYVSAIVWRLWKRGDVMKPDDTRALYSLPEKIEASDDLISRSTSLASDVNPKQDHESGQEGGGT